MSKMKYRPSNGSEGEWFMDKFCYRCRKEAKCVIHFKTMVLEEDDKEYPPEWTYKNEEPTCTAFEEGQPTADQERGEK